MAGVATPSLGARGSGHEGMNPTKNCRGTDLEAPAGRKAELLLMRLGAGAAAFLGLSAAFVALSSRSLRPGSGGGRPGVGANLSAGRMSRQLRAQNPFLTMEQDCEGDTHDIPNIVFVKPHKVGSSTMAAVVRRIAARNGGQPEEVLRQVGTADFFAKSRNQPVGEGLHIWSNHETCEELMRDTDADVVDAAFKFTLTRNPVDRCLSSYYYTQKLPRPVGAALLNDKLAHHCRPMASYIKPKHSSSVQETVGFYDFIGVTERYVESVAALKMILGLSFGDVLYLASKQADGHHSLFGSGAGSGLETDVLARPPLDEEPPKVIQHFKNLKGMDEDVELWELANTRLDEWIERLQPGFSLVNATLHAAIAYTAEQCDMDFVEIRTKCYVADIGCNYECLDGISAEFGLNARTKRHGLGLDYML